MVQNKSIDIAADKVTQWNNLLARQYKSLCDIKTEQGETLLTIACKRECWREAHAILDGAYMCSEDLFLQLLFQQSPIIGYTKALNGKFKPTCSATPLWWALQFGGLPCIENIKQQARNQGLPSITAAGIMFAYHGESCGCVISASCN